MENTNHNELNMAWVMRQIETILHDKEHLEDTIKSLQQLEPHSNSAHAIGEVITQREATNQQTLALLAKMYDDLKPQRETVSQKNLAAAFDKLLEQVEHWETIPEVMSNAFAEVIRAQAGK